MQDDKVVEEYSAIFDNKTETRFRAPQDRDFGQWQAARFTNPGYNRH